MGFTPFDPYPLPVSKGGTGEATAATALAALGGLGLVATTGVDGFALQDATPTILTWTAPDDGHLHLATLSAFLSVTEAETGGDLTASFSAPDGTSQSDYGVFSGGLTVGQGLPTQPQTYLIAPGGTFSFVQYSALTAGAAKVYAEIWAV